MGEVKKRVNGRVGEMKVENRERQKRTGDRKKAEWREQWK